MKFSRVLRQLVRDQDGQDLIEYALLAAFIALAAIGAAGALGTALSEKFDEITSSVKAGPSM